LIEADATEDAETFITEPLRTLGRTEDTLAAARQACPCLKSLAAEDAKGGKLDDDCCDCPELGVRALATPARPAFE
jgi:hypothetical protein